MGGNYYRPAHPSSHFYRGVPQSEGRFPIMDSGSANILSIIEVLAQLSICVVG